MKRAADEKSPQPRVLVVAKWPVGGIRTYLQYVLGNSAFADYRFVVAVPRQPEDQEGSLRTALAGANVESFEFCELSNEALFRTVTTVLSSREIRLVHAHGFTAGALAALPATLRGIPTLMTAHEVLTRPQFVGWRGSLKRIGLTIALNRLTAIHSVSHDAQANIREFLPQVNRPRLVTIANGIDVGRFAEGSTTDLHAQLGLPRDAFTIGFFGRFMSPKGFRVLIRAIEILSASGAIARPFAVVAVGGGGFVREDRDLIAGKGLSKYFHFLPFQESIAATMRGVDVVAMPSLWEACPLVAMEALVAGVPVVGSDCVGLREVLRDTPAVSFPARDCEALAAALIEMSQNSEQHRSAARAFAPIARDRFDVASVARRTAQLYEELILTKSAGKFTRAQISGESTPT
jgi:glycosyltransferase involved in cell wall biosynthesis